MSLDVLYEHHGVRSYRWPPFDQQSSTMLLSRSDCLWMSGKSPSFSGHDVVVGFLHVTRVVSFASSSMTGVLHKERKYSTAIHKERKTIIILCMVRHKIKTQQTEIEIKAL